MIPHMTPCKPLPLTLILSPMTGYRGGMRLQVHVWFMHCLGEKKQNAFFLGFINKSPSQKSSIKIVLLKYFRLLHFSV